MKSVFEQMGGTYKQVGDYLLPDVELPKGKTFRPTQAAIRAKKN